MSRILAAITSVLALATVAMAQGVAESALTHALSTATETTAGKALGKATNQMTNRVAGRLGQQTTVSSPRSVVTNARPDPQKRFASMTTAEPPAGGSMIQSIQGSAPQSCVATAQNDRAANASSAAEKSAAKAGEGPLLPAQDRLCPATSDTYPSVIILPPPK